MDAELRRQQLVRLTPQAWARLQTEVQAEAAPDDVLARWAAHDWPLVVPGQAACVAQPPGHWRLGLPTPPAWGRQRRVLHVSADEVAWVGDFPRAESVTQSLAIAVQSAWRDLCDALVRLGIEPRVYGSHGWQQCTGLPYVQATSDIDLLLPVADAAQADAVVHVLAAASPALPRLDGELMGPDDQAVAWREWQAWRAGRVASVLVKQRAGAVLSREPWT